MLYNEQFGLSCGFEFDGRESFDRVVEAVNLQPIADQILASFTPGNINQSRKL